MTDGIGIRKDGASRILRDENVGRMILVVGREIASGNEWDAERGGITGADPADIRVGFVAGRHGMVGPGDAVDPYIAGERKFGGGSNRLHAGNLAERCEGAFDEGATRGACLVHSVAILRCVEEGACQSDAAGVEVAVLSEECGEAADEQASDEETRVVLVCSADCGSTRMERSAGSSPKKSAVKMESPAAANRTGQETCTVPMRGRLFGAAAMNI